MATLVQPRSAAKNTGTGFLSTGGGGGSGSAATGVLSGDVTGPEAATLVSLLQGQTLTLGTPATDQVLTWDGTQWINGPVAVITAPDSPTRNTIQPTADANAGLVVKGHSPTQSAPLEDWQESTGVSLGQIRPTSGYGGALPVIGLTPLASQVGLIVQMPASPGDYATEVRDNLGRFTFATATDAGIDVSAFSTSYQDNTAFQASVIHTALTHPITQFFHYNDAFGLLAETDFNGDGSILWRNAGSAGGAVETARLLPGFLDNTTGAEKGRLDLLASDFNAERTVIRMEADGSFPLTHIMGSLSLLQVTKSANYTLTTGDFAVWGDATAGAFTLTLPTAVGCQGRLYSLKKVDPTPNPVTVGTTAGQTIDGGGFILAPGNEAIMVMSDGANWKIPAGWIPPAAAATSMLAFWMGGASD